MNAIRDRIKVITETLGGLRYSHRTPVEGIRFCEGDYKICRRFSPEGKAWEPFERGRTWGGYDSHFWFWAEPAGEAWMAGRQVRAILHTGETDLWNTDNPQILVYRDGELAGTMDMNHREIILADGVTRSLEPGEKVSLAFYAYSSGYSSPQPPSNFFRLETAVYHPDVAALYYDMKVLFEAADYLEEDDLERIRTFRLLNECAGLLDLRRTDSPEFYDSAEQARQFLEERKEPGRLPVTVHSIGHTHIDVAWKWPLRQTRQKAVRSFNTVLNLMERYPEYRFMSSQPQLYQFVKEEAPELFDRVRERVKEGRWETEGAMWVEPDCNLTSGESLIRQILYGQRFFREEFGSEPSQVLWLPDVFGYSAALPQILRKSGLRYFMTTKINWNEYNQFPNDTFLWRGIDGSEVLTYLITTRDYRKQDAGGRAPINTTYNGLQNVSQIMGTWQRYQNKDLSRDVLTCYGYGDGGGGPTEEMLEVSRRLEQGALRTPAVRQTFVKEFFHILEEKTDRKRLPVWSGELYLEFHRGTYTSMARNKRYNRKSEFLLADAELYSAMARELTEDFSYPAEELDRDWRLLLLNQFHDILPGSSIREVYEDSAAQYEELAASAGKLAADARRALLAGWEKPEEKSEDRSLVVWNSLSFARTGLVSCEAGKVPAGLAHQTAADGTVFCLAENVPAKGYRSFGPGGQAAGCESRGGERQDEAPGSVIRILREEEDGRPVQLETPFYEIDFDGCGRMTRIYDRREDREILKEGQAGNQLLVYEDRPREYDAWNIDASYVEKVWPVDGLKRLCLLENGPLRGCILAEWSFLDSVIRQTICFYRHTARIDFQTYADWHQHQLLLKTAFPVDVLADTASYEIQFGNVSRPTHWNTSWDQARFEVCGHKWADISEDGYGVALLNDCKYGYDIHDSVMKLTLIKSGIFPNPEADQGSHQFTYALYPHHGGFRAGGVIREAYDLNCPLTAETAGKLSRESVSFLAVQEENVIAETVKKEEAGAGTVIRLYEAWGRRTKVHMLLPWAAGKRAAECDCMEKELDDLSVTDGGLEFEMKPYEIKTIKIG